jgi:predicted nucleic acid-binding protein
MPVFYFDSSAAVKRYVAETGTAWVVSLFKPSAKNIIYVAQITGIEVVSAISRRQRGGSLTSSAAQKSNARFKKDFQNKLRVLRLTDTVVSDAIRLAEAHGLRGYDAVQLATALELAHRFTANNLPTIIFISADNQLNQAAQTEGLAVDNPNNH